MSRQYNNLLYWQFRAGRQSSEQRGGGERRKKIPVRCSWGFWKQTTVKGHMFTVVFPWCEGRCYSGRERKARMGTLHKAQAASSTRILIVDNFNLGREEG